MSSIKIYNVGPLKEVVIDDLKRVNVFIGASASGKSTIAKIISQAIWCEKNYITKGEETDFHEQLIAFHRFSGRYFTEKSRIEYRSPWLSIVCRWKGGKQLRFETEYKPLDGAEGLYHNVKVQYIPAERNLVSAIPNLQEYNKSYDNVINFVQDWLSYKGQYRDVRTSYKIDDVEGLKLKFRTLQEGTVDLVRLSSGEIDVELLNNSSGIQSALPLLLVADEVLEKIYLKKKPFSFTELKHLENKVAAHELMPVIQALNEISRKGSVPDSFDEAVQTLWNTVGYDGSYSGSYLTVEEPEQNIYPSTQRSLIYHLLMKVGDRSSLIITTHSPYVLYAFDNTLVAGQILKKSPSAKKVMEKAFPHLPTGLTDEDVALWHVKDGTITSLIAPETHSLGQNEFNDQLGISVDEMADLYSLASDYSDGDE